RIAQTTFDNSLAVAEETQLQLKAADYAYSAMHTRYTTGLVNLSDIVQVQYNLLEAELAVRKAYWDTWKALLLEAAVKGDTTFCRTDGRLSHFLLRITLLIYHWDQVGGKQIHSGAIADQIAVS